MGGATLTPVNGSQQTNGGAGSLIDVGLRHKPPPLGFHHVLTILHPCDSDVTPGGRGRTQVKPSVGQSTISALERADG